MRTPVEALEARMGYSFKDRSLLDQALTHRSYVNENPGGGPSNQRLEFLGDAVLQLFLTESLFSRFPEEREGVLSTRRAALARGDMLAALGLEIGLDRCLRMGAAESTSGGSSKASALEDALEALIGAVYLDGGPSQARSLVLSLYGDLDRRLAGTEESNPKGRLQELIQPTHGNKALRYEVVQTLGADHAREFEVAVYLVDREIGRGRGTSKKAAEENAARTALEDLR